MDADGLEGLKHLQGLAENNDFDPNNSNTLNIVNMEGVLNGSERIELSHVGGELGTLEEDLEEDTEDEACLTSLPQYFRKVEDWRTRRDRTEWHNHTVESQTPDMVNSYIHEEDLTVQEHLRWCVRTWFLALHGASSVTITVRVLEAYCIQHVRCPQLAIQSFGEKSLRHAWGRVPPISLPAVFYRVRPLPLDIRRRTDERVMHLLGCDSKWRMKHTCPTCMYKLEGEDKLIFDIVTTMDGNDSLKCVLRCDKTSMMEDEAGEPVLGKSKERVDNRDASNGYMYPREWVERWEKTCLAEVSPMGSGNSVSRYCVGYSARG
ncbi:hypothetical protein B0H14DRAFT_3464469 [Mycena olivaceomarginata]|nr:hypothetical protein B0H14DRAFT_3464469 [Mycena olivaceomarginata]